MWKRITGVAHVDRKNSPGFDEPCIRNCLIKLYSVRCGFMWRTWVENHIISHIYPRVRVWPHGLRAQLPCGDIVFHVFHMCFAWDETFFIRIYMAFASNYHVVTWLFVSLTCNLHVIYMCFARDETFVIWIYMAFAHNYHVVTWLFTLALHGTKHL